MTTIQPPLKPGDRVLVEFEAGEDGYLRPITPDGFVVPYSADWLYADSYRWHPMPAADSPDAAHVARLEAERDKGIHREILVWRALAQSIGVDPETQEPVEDSLGMLRRLVRERDALRKVYGAAEAFVDSSRGAWMASLLAAEVDAYRAGEKAPADAPAPRQDDETPAPLAESGSEAPEAQGGAETLPGYEGITLKVSTAVPDDALLLVDRVTGRPLGAVVGPPAAAQPQPTDAPGRRDWAGEITEILDAALFDIKASKALAEHIVTALHLDELGDEFDEMAAALQRLDEHNGEIGSPGQAVAWVLRDLEEARAELAVARDEQRQMAANHAHLRREDHAQIVRLTEQLERARHNANAHSRIADAHVKASIEATRQRDEAAGKLDALRAGVAALADDLAEGIAAAAARPGPTPRKALAALRALLDAPPTTTPDGTGTAEDGA